MHGSLVAAGIGIIVWLLAIVALIAVGRRSAVRELATLIPNLVVLFRGLLRDPKVSRGSKFWLWFAIVWRRSSASPTLEPATDRRTPDRASSVSPLTSPDPHPYIQPFG